MERMLAMAMAISMLALPAACAMGGSEADADESKIDEDPDSGFAPPDGACQGPLGYPTNPAKLTKCCTDFPGQAHCFPTEKVPSMLQSMLTSCEGSSAVCVPDVFIKTGGVFKPPACKAFGGAGVCLSECIPLVAEKTALLLKDVCQEGEKCVPCINPLDKKPTGACDLIGVCNGEDAGKPDTSPPVDSGPAECPHKGPPVIEPTSFPACQCGDSHCVPDSVVPSSMASKLATCSGDPKGKCVPDSLIASGGDFIPATCKSIADVEGRCLSTCLPDVASQAAMLPQSTCGANEKCVPCYNPLDLTDTGACKLSCDPGPTEAPKPLPKCCSTHGTCVPKAAVPASSASALQKDKCPSDEFLCAPDSFLDKSWTHVDCEASLLLLGAAGPGVCMPDCIKGMSFMLTKGSCASGQKCAPCKDPLTGKSTGACELKF